MQAPDAEAHRDPKTDSTERKKKGAEYVGHYQIGQQIGHGASATVHKAMHLLTAEVVAVKTFEATKISKSTMAQILAEADLLKGLQHPNIVRFVECAKKKHQLHIVMEYVEEGSIAQLLDEFGCLPESVCVVYVPQILQGLDYLHSRNVFHRDIKGSNILITKGGGIKLSDFGVSALASESEKRLSVVGTPYWIPPEVINLDGWRPTSDVWSLGCTIIEMLTGSPPHCGLNSMAAMYKIVEEPMPIPEDGPTPALKDFLQTCFIKDPSLRPTPAKLLTHPWIPQQVGYEDLMSTKQRIRKHTLMIEEAQHEGKEQLDAESLSYLKLRASLRPGKRGSAIQPQGIVPPPAAAKNSTSPPRSPHVTPADSNNNYNSNSNSGGSSAGSASPSSPRVAAPPTTVSPRSSLSGEQPTTEAVPSSSSGKLGNIPKPRSIEWSPAVLNADANERSPITLSPRSRRLDVGAHSPRATSPSKRGHVRKESRDMDAMGKLSGSTTPPPTSSSTPLSPAPPRNSSPLTAKRGHVRKESRDLDAMGKLNTSSTTPPSASSLPSSASSLAAARSPSPPSQASLKTSSGSARNVASPEALQKMWSKTEETVLENSRLRKKADDLELELRAVRAERDQLRITNSELTAALDEIASLSAWLANADLTPPGAAVSVAEMRRQLKQALHELQLKNLKKRATERRLGLISPLKERRDDKS